MRGGPAPLLVLVALAACSHRALPPQTTAAPHYVVGTAYESGGTWSYPQERFGYVATGLAERLPDQAGLTADGEIADPTAMAGAHRTLQLPAIVDVTNLETGRQIRIRLDDRGPTRPGRILGLSRRAADLLGIPDAGVAQVRIEMDGPASQSLRDKLGGGPRGITAAPVAAVSQEALGPPGRASLTRVASSASTVLIPMSLDQSLDRLPETVRIVSVEPGQLWVRVAEFTQQRYAEVLRNKLSAAQARIQREGEGRRPNYVVMVGPFASVAAADAGLDQVHASGVTDASIVVE